MTTRQPERDRRPTAPAAGRGVARLREPGPRPWCTWWSSPSAGGTCCSPVWRRWRRWWSRRGSPCRGAARPGWWRWVPRRRPSCCSPSSWWRAAACGSSWWALLLAGPLDRGGTARPPAAVRRPRRRCRPHLGRGHAVLIMNPWSGGGKVERFELERLCRERGIEPIVLVKGSDLLALAEDAVQRGADVIGMAGGDGSQALVASVASRHGIPMVVVPAGTRNHFALDLGRRPRRTSSVRSTPTTTAIDRRIDLAEVNGRVFVNNSSMGLYARIVQSARVPRRQGAHRGRHPARPHRPGRRAARPAVHPSLGRAGHLGQPRAGVEQPLPALAPAGRVDPAAPRRRAARHRLGARAGRRGCREVRRARGRRAGQPVRGLERVDRHRVRGDLRRAGGGRRRRGGADDGPAAALRRPARGR